MQIIFASKNPHKLKEVREILNCSVGGIEDIESLKNLEIIEDGKTYYDNAYKKAKAVCDATGKFALADDSGIEIDRLNGFPGIYSARFLGGEDYDLINSCVLKIMEGVNLENRGARYVCAAVGVFPDGRVIEGRGVFEGVIGYDMIGENGFGYDPIFYVPRFDKTAAQMSFAMKNEISHRAIAFGAIKKALGVCSG
jgi:XTP/dITP diphosphohydrolase